MAGTPTTTSMGDRLLAFIGSFGGQQTVIPVTTIVDSSGAEITSFGGGGAVTVADGADVTFGAKADAAATTDAGTFTYMGLFKRLLGKFPATIGRKAAATSLSVAVAAVPYATVAASQTNAVFGGGSGAIGDYLSHVIIQPATTAAGTVTILDNAVVVFTFTTGTLGDLKPITVPIGAFSVSGAWKCTTGANVSVTGFGNFT